MSTYVAPGNHRLSLRGASGPCQFDAVLRSATRIGVLGSDQLSAVDAELTSCQLRSGGEGPFECSTFCTFTESSHDSSVLTIESAPERLTLTRSSTSVDSDCTV